MRNELSTPLPWAVILSAALSACGPAQNAIRQPVASGPAVVETHTSSAQTSAETDGGASIELQSMLDKDLAQPVPAVAGSTRAIAVVDEHGARHIVVDYNNGKDFFRAGLPFDRNIIDDYKGRRGFWDKAAWSSHVTGGLGRI